jgi:parallel beta-helix repeat protein
MARTAKAAPATFIHAMAILAWSSGDALAATYHVAKAGDDSADGTLERPWRTLRRAADEVKAGDTVRVHPGEYEGFAIEGRAGSAESPILFKADPGVVILRPGPHPARAPFNRLVGSRRWPRWPHGIYVGYASHVTIEGFVVRGMPDAEYAQQGLVHRGGAGIFVHVSDHVTLRKNITDDNGRWGIFTSFADDARIEENECSRSHSEHGIYVSNSADRPIIRRNRCWGNAGSGILLNADIHSDEPDYRARGGVVDGVISSAIVEGNVLLDNGHLRGEGAGINCDGIQDSFIASNLLLENHASGVALYQIDGAEGSRRNRVIGNVILMAQDAGWAIQISNCENPEPTTGLCATGWSPEQRPSAWATGSTGNRVTGNVLLNLNPGAGSIRIDLGSLLKGALAGEPFVSDGNLVLDRMAVGDTVMTLSQWQARTNLDLRSLLAPGGPYGEAAAAHPATQRAAH